jgi:hypothetical protein
MANVRVLGFYSPKHHAVFTHHDTHVISDTPMVTGHVDHLDISEGSQLSLRPVGPGPRAAPSEGK